MSKSASHVSFKVDEVPSGRLYQERKHARRHTPHPKHMQSLIEGGLLTQDAYEHQYERMTARHEQEDLDEERERLFGETAREPTSWRRTLSNFLHFFCG